MLPDSGVYSCLRTPNPINVDGDLAKPVWVKAPRSPRFVDMVSGRPGLLGTSAAALWDETYLYVAYWIEEPFVEAQLTQRDSLIFNENDVELFIDGGDCYYELELNAAGTIYEVLFVWQDALQANSRFNTAEWSPLARRALTFGGDLDRQPKSFWYGTHPRGLRWAYRDFDLSGLRTTVRVDGKINDVQHIDRGWTVELALPWSGLKAVLGDRDCPPRDGDMWRMFFGRFQKLEFGGVELMPHPCWCWTPHGVYDTHRPELWTSVRFSEMCPQTETNEV